MDQQSVKPHEARYGAIVNIKPGVEGSAGFRGSLAWTAPQRGIIMDYKSQFGAFVAWQESPGKVNGAWFTLADLTLSDDTSLFRRD